MAKKKVEETMEKEFDASAFKKSVVSALSKLKNNSIVPNNIDGAPVDTLSVEDFNKLPVALEKLDLRIIGVKYKKPIKGKLARGVKFEFEANGMKFTKMLDIEFKKNKEQVLIASVEPEDIYISSESLKLSPNVLNDGSSKHFEIDSKFEGVVTIYNFKVKNDHNSREVEVSIKVRTRNPEFKPSSKGQKPYYERTVVIQTNEFTYSDVEYKKRQLEKIIEITSKLESPTEKVSDFVVDTKLISDLDAKFLKLKPENVDKDGKEFDYNSSKIRVKLVVKAFDQEVETDAFVKFARSYNEQVLIDFSEENLTLKGFENVISNDDQKVNRDYILENIESDKDVKIDFADQGIIIDPDNKRKITLNFRISCGEYHTLVTTEANLGLGANIHDEVAPSVLSIDIDEPVFTEEVDEIEQIVKVKPKKPKKKKEVITKVEPEQEAEFDIPVLGQYHDDDVDAPEDMFVDGKQEVHEVEK